MDPDYYENVVQQAKIMLYKQKISKCHEILLDKRKTLIKPKNNNNENHNKNKIIIKEREEIKEEEKEKEIESNNNKSINKSTTTTNIPTKPTTKPSSITTNKPIKSNQFSNNDKWNIESSDSDDNNVEEVEYVDLPYICDDDIDCYVNPGSVSPILLREKDIDDKSLILDPKEDLIELQEERRKILEIQNRVNNKESEFVINDDDIDKYIYIKVYIYIFIYFNIYIYMFILLFLFIYINNISQLFILIYSFSYLFIYI